ncbi:MULTISPECIES: heparinase II/III family protein [unclassified Amycolatopsis]|uniref:heparinase II/III family protein n=1 Tax=unclassified Amycolatopsis TaxID=2618356 RepID=UPI0028770607|nr:MULTISPECIES: heparinase II/III family protein [unclassified Amycolatopsis]MDS0140376.1 heparinase II/III family protein [Amycolatopsis sp. 505]MDS0149019.1 heparinase II/III family protein [Amycolatopsis sp. CM201R]
MVLSALFAGRPVARPAFPDVRDRAVWDAADGAALIADARVLLTRPAPVLTATAWARTFRDGVRTDYEDAARELRERVTTLVLAAVLTDELSVLDGAIDGLVALAEATTWCWAPHDRHTAARGEVLADPGDPFLDLGAAEVASLLAWADHVLGPRFDARAPGVRRRLRREVGHRVLTPFERVRDWHWLGLDGDAHNWNPWIHSAVLTAALLLVDDEERRQRLVRLVVEGLDHYLAVLPDDGGIDEGVAYWWHGACRLLECLDLLAGATGVDARELPLPAPLIRFPHRMHLGGDAYVNAGDAPARLPLAQPWHVLHRWGELLGDDEVRAHAVSQARASGRPVWPQAGLGRALSALADPGWRKAWAGDPDGTWLARDQWLPRVQVLVARETAGSVRGLTVAVKAGHNGERHNHLDVGSYWVAVEGVPVVADVGQPTYTAGSFGPDRYRAWPLRSEWHNVPEPGVTQEPGDAFGARDVRVGLTASEAVLSADLAGAYPGVARWIRSVRLVRDTPAHVLVEDDDSVRPVRLRHVLAGDVELAEGEAFVSLGGRRVLRLSWDPLATTAELERRALDDPLLRASWGAHLSRLTLLVREGPARVRLEQVR